METLHQWKRQSQGRLPEPSVCSAESQSIKTATQDTEVGFDGNKKIGYLLRTGQRSVGQVR